MPREVRRAAAFVACWLLSVISTALAQSPTRWLAHDMQRPHPAVVTPAKQALSVPPPADAVKVFDGTDL
jgi:hypothetical protein